MRKDDKYELPPGTVISANRRMNPCDCLNEKIGAGRVYIIECLGRIKIGITCSDLLTRLKSISHSSPEPITLVASRYFEYVVTAERKMHLAFSHRRTNGEWFHSDIKDQAVAMLKEIPDASID